MKALMYAAEHELKMMDIPTPEGEFLVRVEGSAICGTDLKTYLHGHPYFVPPTILGHEFYGRVMKAPAGCGCKEGDPVVVAPYGDCGVCPTCKRGAGELCKQKNYVSGGSFCEVVEVPLDFVKDGVLPIPECDDVYALVEPLSCVLCGIGKVRMDTVTRALIVGGGPMGALFGLTLSDRGIPTDMAEVNPARREKLRELGLSAKDSSEVNYKDYDLIVVAVNIPALIEAAVNGVADNGTVLMFAGMPSGTTVTLDCKPIHYRAVTLTGSSGFALSHFREAYECIKNKPDHYRRLITHRFPLEAGEEAFDTLRKGEAFKIVLKP